MLRDREQELCHICAVVHAEVSAVALIALVLMTCYLDGKGQTTAQLHSSHTLVK